MRYVSRADPLSARYPTRVALRCAYTRYVTKPTRRGTVSSCTRCALPTPCLQLPSSFACQPHGKADDLGPRYNYPSLGFYTTTTLGQMHALRRRITRAGHGEWGTLWQESLSAHKGRADWYSQRFPYQRNISTHAHRTARTMRFASHAQHTRAMRLLTNAPIADLNDPHTHAGLQSLHTSPSNHIEPISDRDLPPSTEIDEAAELRAVKRMNPNAAAGPDRMPPRLLHFLVTGEVSPEAGVTGLSVLTRLVGRLARGQIPNQSFPLLSGATLLPIQPRPDKIISPIAIGQVLRRLVTKVLLPATIADTKGYLEPEQLANGIPSAMDAVVHDARMLMKRYGQDSDFVMVPIDAKSAFNSYSRHRMLNILPERAPSLARFTNALYAETS